MLSIAWLTLAAGALIRDDSIYEADVREHESPGTKIPTSKSPQIFVTYHERNASLLESGAKKAVGDIGVLTVHIGELKSTKLEGKKKYVKFSSKGWADVGEGFHIRSEEERKRILPDGFLLGKADNAVWRIEPMDGTNVLHLNADGPATRCRSNCKCATEKDEKDWVRKGTTRKDYCGVTREVTAQNVDALFHFPFDHYASDFIFGTFKVKQKAFPRWKKTVGSCIPTFKEKVFRRILKPFGGKTSMVPQPQQIEQDLLREERKERNVQLWAYTDENKEQLHTSRVKFTYTPEIHVTNDVRSDDTAYISAAAMRPHILDVDLLATSLEDDSLTEGSCYTATTTREGVTGEGHLKVAYSVAWDPPLLQPQQSRGVFRKGDQVVNMMGGWDTEELPSGGDLDLDLFLVPLNGALQSLPNVHGKEDPDRKIFWGQVSSKDGRAVQRRDVPGSDCNMDGGSASCTHMKSYFARPKHQGGRGAPADYYKFCACEGWWAYLPIDDQSGDDPGDDELLSLDFERLGNTRPDIQALAVGIHLYSDKVPAPTLKEVDSAYARIVQGGTVQSNQNSNFHVHGASQVMAFSRISGDGFKMDPAYDTHCLVLGFFFKVGRSEWRYMDLKEPMKTGAGCQPTNVRPEAVAQAVAQAGGRAAAQQGAAWR